MRRKTKSNDYISERVVSGSDAQWLSDVITDIDLWNVGDIVTIHAETGKGKSYWVKNELYEKAKSEGGKILFLLHRARCKQQFKHEIIEAGKEDVIDVETYQFFDFHIRANDLQHVSNESDVIQRLNEYKYIVCDEAHYFITDSGFNIYTDLAFTEIMRQNNIIRIFMSATADWIDSYIIGMGNRIRRYEITKTFENIASIQFLRENDEDLVSLLNEIESTDEKAVVFINDKELALDFHRDYSDSLFLCGGDERRYKRYINEEKISNMLENCYFDEKFLFTTTVLDTGVSLKDEKLKHFILVNIRESDVLMQCIGRNRGIAVNVYIKKWSSSHSRELIKRRNEFQRYQDYNELILKDYLKEYYDGDTNLEIAMALLPEDIAYDAAQANNHLRCLKTKMLYTEIQMIIELGYEKYMSAKFGAKKSWKPYHSNQYISTLRDYQNHYIYGSVKDEFIECLNARDDRGRLIRRLSNINLWFEVQKLPFKIESERRRINNAENPISYWSLMNK